MKRARVSPSLGLLVCLLCLPPSLAAQQTTKPIRFGLQVAQQQTTVQELKHVWQEAEALGFDTLWTNDHLLPSVGPSDKVNLEAWTLLAAMATVTSRVQIGTMVSSNTFRHPSVLAKMATTVDHLSQGRLILGVGFGWFAREHQAFGVPFPKMKERSQRLAEALQLITALWGANPTASFSGTYYSLVDAPFEPKPVQQPHPPILIGGIGEKRTLPLVAKYASMWNIPMLTPDQIREKSQVLEHLCQAIHRDCDEIERSILTPVYIRTDPAEVQTLLERIAGLRNIPVEQARKMILAGTPEEIRRQIQTYIDVGVTHFIVNLRRPGLYDRDAVRIFAQEIMPGFKNN
jgi:F420-dependent oxidoreductase-like protein